MCAFPAPMLKQEVQTFVDYISLCNSDWTTGGRGAALGSSLGSGSGESGSRHVAASLMAVSICGPSM